MLFRGPGSEELTRIQGVYVNDMESARIIDHLKSRQDIDSRSQFSSAKGRNFTYNYLGVNRPNFNEG